MTEMLVEFVKNLANSLMTNGLTMRGPELAIQLNQNGFTTIRGTEYKRGRGIYAVLTGVWRRLKARGLDNDAENVALAFVNSDGSHAWRQKAEREE